ncbi:MAG TPA: hypothetical protein VLB82_02175 [Thermodesulfobacteriota bacterium]|nr:hypothetical protein [Thermodesulfobacteriota bacterium]
MAQNIYQFLLEPGLQELYRDKDTGLPLSNGQIIFFKDKARTELKPVYELTGAPDDPVYVPLPNPLALTGIGSASNGFGDDIKFYYNPYDENGDVELYYIEVYNEDGVLQFTREGWPQQIDTSNVDDTTFVNNYYQDSQFLYHLDVPNNGVLTQEVTNLSYGGWVFLLPAGYTSTNTVVFERFNDYVENPEVSPRYACRVSMVNPNPAEPYKDLTWINNNVNFLAEKTVTLQFEALSNSGFSTNVEVYYEKVYGSGGSPSETTFVGLFSINSVDWDKYTVSFTISDNLGKVIGPNDDDEIRFIVRLPSDIVFDVSFVNFMLVNGEFEVLTHPEVSNYQSKLNALASSIEGPAFDNTNAGDVLTVGGITSTAVGSTGTPLSAFIWQPAVPSGSVLPFFSDTIPTGYLSCNGGSFDLVGINSSDEYVRLFNVIGTTSGFGADTFIPTKTAVNQLTLTCSVVGAAAIPNPADSGFTINITVIGDSVTQQVVTVNTIDASLMTPGAFFQVGAPSSRTSTYWFRIDGVGTPPTVPSSDLVGVVDINSSDSADQVADAIVNSAVLQVRTPDLRGMFIRGWDDGRGLDPDSADRLDPTFTNTVGDVVGSVQSDALQQHGHLIPLIVGTGSQGSSRNVLDGQGNTQSTGDIQNANVSTETRSVNTYLQFIIKT